MPLNDRVVVITRPAEQAEEMAELVAKLGGKPRIVSTVELRPISNPESIREPLELITSGRVDVVIFMSQNGVSSLIKASESLGLKDYLIETLNRVCTIAIGPKTKRRLEEYGVKVGFTPAESSSDGIAETVGKLGLKGRLVALPRADKVTDHLAKRLRELQVEFIQFPVYETRPPSDRTEVLTLINDMADGRVDAITFTSSSAALNLFQVAEEHGLVDMLRRALAEYVLVVAIGPVTKGTLERLGAKVHVMPEVYTVESMMHALEIYLDGRSCDLDLFDRRILSELQRDIPLTSNLWSEIGERVGLNEGELLSRLIRLRESGLIRKIRPVIDAKRIGLEASTLVGVRVPRERVEEVARIVNGYVEVSHNYEREHEYNLWFTLTARDRDELKRILGEIRRRIGVGEGDILDLPTRRVFKIKVEFDIGR